MLNGGTTQNKEVMVSKAKSNATPAPKGGKQPSRPAAPTTKATARADDRTMRRIVRQAEATVEEADSSSTEEEDESILDTDHSDDDFEQQSSSESSAEGQDMESEDELLAAESAQRSFPSRKPTAQALQLHVDDLSSDDEEGELNTIGRVPLHWYDAYDHIGYTREGSKITRGSKDRIDLALEAADSGTKKVYDMYNDREVALSERDLEIIHRIQSNAFAHPEFNATPDYVDYFSSSVEVMPISAVPAAKASFLPSKWDMARIKSILKAMDDGTYVMIKDRPKAGATTSSTTTHLLWGDTEEEILQSSRLFHLPAPKLPLPGHAESYNPPEEYLLAPDEVAVWEGQDREDRKISFLPHKHNSLREVGRYEDFVKERYERCLDLYLCPRKLKKRLNIDPESLIPQLPSPRELKPFPNTLAIQFIGHTSPVKVLSISPDGQYLASGDLSGMVRVWEIKNAYCRYAWKLDAKDSSNTTISLAWNPSPNHCLLVAAYGNKVIFITPGHSNADTVEMTEALLAEVMDAAKGKRSLEQVDEDDSTEATMKKNVQLTWHLRTDNQTTSKGLVGARVELVFSHAVSQVTWHGKGDYLAVLTPSAASSSISIHQISKAKSQFPFSKSPGKVEGLAFHPTLPCLVVVTQTYVKLFHLVEQKLIKKLQSNCKWLSCMDIHTSGDHVIVGSYDRRVVWFDLDLASTPYKTLKFHEKAVRAVTFHKKYPLFASAADDGSVHIFHCMVYNDLMRNPLIVPLKVLKEHGVKGDLGVLALAFHPKQPWIFSSGADGLINLYQDL